MTYKTSGAIIQKLKERKLKMSDCLILNADGNPLSVVPLSVVSWQTAIRLAYQEKVRIMCEYDDWEVHSPSCTWKVPSVVICSDFIKWHRQVKYNRTNILLRDLYTCQLCSAKPPANQLTLDHVVPRIHGGKTNWTNIVAACKRCNHKKGASQKIKPKVLPTKPNYYELCAKRMKFPIIIRDKTWLQFLSWNEKLVEFRPPRKNI